MWLGGETGISLEKYSDKEIEVACMKALRKCQGLLLFIVITIQLLNSLVDIALLPVFYTTYIWLINGVGTFPNPTFRNCTDF